MMSHDGTRVLEMVGSVSSSDIFIIQELLPHMQPCTDWPSKQSGNGLESLIPEQQTGHF